MQQAPLPAGPPFLFLPVPPADGRVQRPDGAKDGDRVNKRGSWGPVAAALALGVLVIIVAGAFYLGVRGLF